MREATVGIREYRDDDLEAVMDIWYRASKVGHPFLSEEFLRDDRDEIIRECIPRARQWVFDIDGTVVGFIAMLDSHVGGLFVDPDHHRQGIGRVLVQHVIDRYAELTVNVYEPNLTARRFYESLGFELDERGVCPRSGVTDLLLRRRWRPITTL